MPDLQGKTTRRKAIATGGSLALATAGGFAGAALVKSQGLKSPYYVPLGEVPKRPIDGAKRQVLVYDLRIHQGIADDSAKIRTGAVGGAAAGLGAGTFLNPTSTRRQLLKGIAQGTLYVGLGAANVVASGYLENLNKAPVIAEINALDAVLGKFQAAGYQVRRTGNLNEFTEFLRQAGAQNRPKDAKTVLLFNTHGGFFQRYGTLLGSGNRNTPLIPLPVVASLLKSIKGQKLVAVGSCQVDPTPFEKSRSTTLLVQNAGDPKIESFAGLPFFNSLLIGMHGKEVSSATQEAYERLMREKAPENIKKWARVSKVGFKAFGARKFSL